MNNTKIRELNDTISELKSLTCIYNKGVVKLASIGNTGDIKLSIPDEVGKRLAASISTAIGEIKEGYVNQLELELKGEVGGIGNAGISDATIIEGENIFIK